MKKLISMTVIATLVMSSTVYAAADLAPLRTRAVDVVAAATGTTTPAPKPSTPAPKPTPKPATPAPKPAPKPATPAPAAPAKPTSPATNAGLTRVLTTGSKGADVKLVQGLLNKNGAKLVADGIFGKKTAAAVKSYQGKNGLAATGTVDAATYAKLSGAIVKVDAVTTASLVNTAAAFEKAISANGTWIITTLNDLTINKELVVEGTFYDKNDKTKDLKRKIGLYTQDDKKNVTARFSLTAPKLTVKSPNTVIQSSTFNGDIYVSAPKFQLKDTVVNGNIYFTTQEAKDTFIIDTKSKVNGKQIIAQIDAVATASIVDSNAAFEKAISTNGSWIPCILRDLTFDKELVLEGEFYDKNDKAKGLKRKVALYSQDDKKNVTRRFTLTAPKLTIKSTNANLSKGIFVGDVYVSATGFQLIDTKVDGNIYFTTQAAKDTFKMDAASTVTGKLILAQVDAVATASIVDSNTAFEKAISSSGTWIPCILRDLTFDKELVLEGTFYDKNDKAKGLKRKVALYSQDDKKNVTRRFTLTAPKLTIKSPNANLSKGIFKGDVYVTATGFQLIDTKVEGNIYFTTQAAKDTFKMDAPSVVTGTIGFADVDAVASASIVRDEAAFEKAISTNGTWIPALLKDMTFSKELVLEGTFYDKNDRAKGEKRKIALYTQDAKKNVILRFTLTAPKLTIKSPNANISKGTFKGDIYVSAPGFRLIDAKVDGNIYFTTDEAINSFQMDSTSSLTGKLIFKAE